jgi:vacuolar-type H+-ATPase subunit F/Vma7
MNWVVLSDEITALGWRLAGAKVLVTDARSVADRFAQARKDADLLLVTADLARTLPAGVLDAALVAERPLTVLIGRGEEQPPDVEREVKRAIGVGL